MRILFILSLALTVLAGASFARVPDTTVTYARIDSLELKLDLYMAGRPAGIGQPNYIAPIVSPLSVPPIVRRPVILWIHGGGWRGGSRADFSPAWSWVDSGYTVASIDYRLSNRKKWPAQIQDVKAAVRWLRVHADVFELDTARFVAWGSSAGAHLAAMAGLTTRKDAFDGETGEHPQTGSHVHGVIDYYGATNFLEPNPKRWAPWSSVGELLGCGVRKCPERAYWASPVNYVNRGDVPFLIVHGTLDTVVPISQSILLDSLLRAAQVPVEFHRVEDGHGGPTYTADSTQAWVGSFLRRVLGPVAPVAPRSPAPNPVPGDTAARAANKAAAVNPPSPKSP